MNSYTIFDTIIQFDHNEGREVTGYESLSQRIIVEIELRSSETHIGQWIQESEKSFSSFHRNLEYGKRLSMEYPYLFLLLVPEGA